MDLLFYSNVWIAACAAAMCYQTQLLLFGQVHPKPLGAFIFFSTLLLYALHRLVGLKKAEGFKNKGRYLVIERFRLHIGLYALLAGLATLWFGWQLPWKIWWWIVPVALISMGYVLPIFSRGRRLRDFHYIKIFLIALAWAWITVFLPAVEFNLLHCIPLGFLFFERLFFIFALALPFDIRDLEIDSANHVQTIPALLGISKSKYLACCSLLLSASFGYLVFRLNAYTFGGFVGLLLSLFLTGLVVRYTKSERHDYYFSGLVDGMMILQFVAVWVGMWW